MATWLALASALVGGSAWAAPSVGGRYVSMGSSYAAGPGVGVRDAASGACGRSLSNYARQVAARRGLTLVDVACSGATTADILARSAARLPAQIEAVTADAQLVTITIGGNDVAYVANLMGYSCRDAGGACSVVSDADVEARFAALPQALHRVLAETRRRAPRAKVFLVGYPPVVPEAGRPGCGAEEPMSAANADRMRGVADRLAKAFEAAAKKDRAVFIPSHEIARGHDACAAEPWVAGYKPTLTTGWSLPVAYHPNQAGMDRLAEAIDDGLPRQAPQAAAPASIPAAKGAPFSAAVQVGGILYLSGQIGVDAGGKLPEGMTAQTRQAMENIRGVLRSRGLSMDSVFKCTVMLADMRRWADFNAVYVTYFRPDRLPARSALGANGLALGAEVEIECWAHAPPR